MIISALPYGPPQDAAAEPRNGKSKQVIRNCMLRFAITIVMLGDCAAMNQYSIACDGGLHPVHCNSHRYAVIFAASSVLRRAYYFRVAYASL